MAGKPWEKFKPAAAPAEEAGPWQKFKPESDVAEEEDPIQADISRRSKALGVAGEGLRKAPADLAARRPRNASELRAMGEAALAGPTQAITFGHGPEIVGRVNSLAKGTPYVEERDQAYRDLNEIKERAPLTFGLTNLGTNLAMPLKGGKSAMGSMAKGFTLAAAQNPGVEEGVVDPLQLGRRAAQGGFGAMFGAGTNAGSSVTTAGGRAYGMKKEMNKPFFSKKLSEEVTAATKEVGKNYVNPRAARARAALRQKQISFDPEALADADEPGLYAALVARTPKAQKAAAAAQSGGIAPPAPPAPNDHLVTLRGDVADRVRSKLESKGAYKQRNAYGHPQTLKSAEGTVKAARAIRSERNRVAPELKQNFGEQKYALDVMKDLRNSGTGPQALLEGGKDTASKLKDADFMSGTTNLSRMGRDLRAANYLNGGPRRTEIPYIDPAVRVGANAAAWASQPAAWLERALPQKIQDRMSPALLRSLVERAMSGPEYEEEEQ
jgi:hypothetical protein